MTDVALFFGDSIVAQGLYTAYVAERVPWVQVVARGRDGATAGDGLARFEADVVPLQPRWVFIAFGMNDGGYRGLIPWTLERYREQLTALVQRVKAIGAVPVLLSPTCVDPAASPVLGVYNDTLRHFVAACRSVAEANGCAFVDLFEAMLRAVAARPGVLIPDGVHPGPEGHRLVAKVILEQYPLR